MLLRFGVENHRSIRSYQELSFVATSLKDSDEGLLSARPDFPLAEESSGMRVLPAIGMYGANAAGKSTVLDAIDFFVRAVRLSHAQGEAGGGTPFQPFLLDDESRAKPSRYDADFALGSHRYHYGFSLDGKRIIEEWLYSFPLDAKRSVRTTLFYRDSDTPIGFSFSKALKGENKQIAKLVRPNSLFLSAAAQNAHPVLSEIYEYLAGGIVTRSMRDALPNMLPKQLLAYFGESDERKAEAVRFLSAADVGVLGMDFSKGVLDDDVKAMIQDFEQFVSKHVGKPPPPDLLDTSLKVKLLHRGAVGKSYPIDLKAESAGTISLLQLLGPIFSSLRSGGVVLLDELNSTLHPLVCRELIRLFCMRGTNPGGAQLIFSTHDTNLLTGGLLRRDQVWFAEKDGEGATQIYPLSDISVRGTDDFERGYLTGRFGAVPFIGMEKLDWTSQPKVAL